MPVCIHTQVCHAWPFKAGLSRDGGLEHKSKVSFRLMLVAEHQGMLLTRSQRREMENSNVCTTTAFRGKWEMLEIVYFSLLSFPLLLLRMRGLTEQEDQRWLLVFFLND